MNGIQLKRLDWTMLGSILLLIGLSACFIYSAQFKSDEAVGSNWIKQLVFAGMGLCAYATIVWFDYSNVARLSWWIYGGAILLLIIVLFCPEKNGSHRWIFLPGFTLQPSELGKIAVVIGLSGFLASPDRDTDEWNTFFGCAAIVSLPFLLIAAEPDLSTSLTLAPISLAIMLYSGVQRRLLLIGVATVVLFAAVACIWIKYETTPEVEQMEKAERPKVVLPRMPFLEDYQKGRIKVFLTKDHDLAVAPTDFIFCVIAEETGFMGGAFFIVLYTVLLGRCMRVSFRSRDEFGRLMALGIGVMLFCHVFVNIAMTIGVLPITGLPLPLMSYGGSFMVSTMIALGLVQSVYQRRRIR
jgi:rod shape determining protein RodA